MLSKKKPIEYVEDVTIIIGAAAIIVGILLVNKLVNSRYNEKEVKEQIQDDNKYVDNVEVSDADGSTSYIDINTLSGNINHDVPAEIGIEGMKLIQSNLERYAEYISLNSKKSVLDDSLFADDIKEKLDNQFYVESVNGEDITYIEIIPDQEETLNYRGQELKTKDVELTWIDTNTFYRTDDSNIIFIYSYYDTDGSTRRLVATYSKLDKKIISVEVY